MEFEKYQHVEKWGTVETEGIEYGTCYVFPKIDGSNGSIWVDDKLNITCGSRNRELQTDNDNAGFCEWVKSQSVFTEFFSAFPYVRLYGEWLVPHTLKTYRDDAWRKFYVFDVEINDDVIPYEEYKTMMDEYNIEYIPALCKIENPTFEKLISLLDKNDYLIKDGCGPGEGIVIKNYFYTNRFGRKTWAKIVTSDFKTKHRKESSDVLEVKEKQMTEKLIADKYVNESLISKVHANIVNENNGWSSNRIPQLLNTVYYDLIREESWNFVKEFKEPTINYKTLRHFTNAKVKATKPELF